MKIPVHVLLTGAVLCLTGPVSAQEKPSPTIVKVENKPVPTPSSVHEVKKEKLQAIIRLTGKVEASDGVEIALEPKQWTDLEVLEVAAHGTRVKKGDSLLKLNDEKLKEAIETLERSRKAAQLNLEAAREQLEILKITTPKNLDLAKKSYREALDDIDYYFDTTRKMNIKGAQETLEMYEFQFAYAQEDLNQLLKMYEADDLTEETEEIIVERARQQVKQAKSNLERAKIRHQRTMNVSLPRADRTAEVEKVKTELSWKQQREAIPRALALKKEEIAKLEVDDEKIVEKLDELKADLRLMNTASPVSGIVYYGVIQDGSMTTGATVQKKLIKGGKITSKEVVMTVVPDGNNLVSAVLPENQLSLITEGMEGVASTSTDPLKKLKAKVVRIDTAPRTGGGFEVEVELQNGKKDVSELPGISCKVTFVPVNEPETIQVPLDSVFFEEESGKPYVIVIRPDLGAEKRKVVLGKHDSKMIQIKKGVKEGEKVSTILIPAKVFPKAKASDDVKDTSKRSDESEEIKSTKKPVEEEKPDSPEKPDDSPQDASGDQAAENKTENE